jgi:hypothetical protein
MPNTFARSVLSRRRWTSLPSRFATGTHEVREAQEKFKRGQKGSSAMPHKRESDSF